MHTLKIASVATQKYGWIWYAYEPSEGLHSYSSDEIDDMHNNGFKIKVVDTLDDLIKGGFN